MADYLFSNGINLLENIHYNGGSLKLHSLNDKELMELVDKYIRVVEIKGEIYAVLLRNDLIISA
jgi:hypothetical protein